LHTINKRLSAFCPYYKRLLQLFENIDIKSCTPMHCTVIMWMWSLVTGHCSKN